VPDFAAATERLAGDKVFAYSAPTTSSLDVAAGLFILDTAL
jgi:hypothetical protein